MKPNNLKSKLARQNGVTILEAVITLAILGVVGSVIASVMSNSYSVQSKIAYRGTVEDLRNMIREGFSCEKTGKLTKAVCKNKLFNDKVYVALYTENGEVVLPKSATGVQLTKNLQVRASCQSAKAGIVEFRVEHKNTKSTDWENTFEALDAECTFGSNWYPVVGQNCTAGCALLGMASTRSIETYPPPLLGSFCASGECYPRSAAEAWVDGDFSQVFGVWGTPGPAFPPGMQMCASQGGRCYGIKSWVPGFPGQKVDNDSTDTTVACHCE